MITSFRPSGTLLLAALLLLPLPSRAQVPDKFENLKFFREDISKEELVENMRQFCFALGVRCTFCHVAKDDDPDRVGDFASDDKEEKTKARVMLEMVRAINSEFLPKLPEREKITVTCATCHGGIQEPRRLEDELAEVRESEGMDAAVARYRTLREHYYGTKAYDFGPRSLMSFGAHRLDAGAAEEAVTALELNREFFPESLEVTFTLAQAYGAAGRNDDAVAAYRKVLEQAPKGGWARAAQKAIDEITGE